MNGQQRMTPGVGPGAERGVSAFAAAGVAQEGAFSVGGVLGKTFRVWGANVVTFSAVTLLFQSPAIAGNFALGAPTFGQPDPDVWLRQGLALLGAVLSFAAAGALTYGVLAALRGRPAELGELLRFGLRNLWRTLVVSFGVGFFTMLGLLLLFVPGVIVAVMLAVAVPAAVSEPALSHGDALRRSRSLTKGHRLALFLVLLVVWAVVAIPVMPLSTAAVFVPALQGGVAYGLITVLSAVLGGLFSTSQAVAYHDLRVAKEGVATDQLAAIFD